LYKTTVFYAQFVIFLEVLKAGAIPPDAKLVSTRVENGVLDVIEKKTAHLKTIIIL